MLVARSCGGAGRSGGVLSNQVGLIGVDATLKGGAVEMLNSAQSWIVDANRVWTNQTIRRYNKAFVRWPAGWTSKSISFNAICTMLTNSDGKFAVVVDGALAATVTVAGDLTNRRYDVTNLPVSGSGSTVEVWEPFEGRNTLNNGADAPIEGGYVTGVWLPPGMSLTKPTATTGIVIMGDSIMGATNTSPECWGSVAGVVRKNAHALGRLVATLDYGSATMCGDGYTGANIATLIQQAVTAMGATTVYVLFAIGGNDWNYYGGTLTTSPTTYGTALQAAVTALPAAYNKVILTTTSRAAEGANGGGFTLPNYRTQAAGVTGTNVTIVDGAGLGINTGTDLYDGTHPNASGVTKIEAGVHTPLGF